MSDPNAITDSNPTVETGAAQTESQGELAPFKRRGKFFRKIVEFIGAVLFLRVKSGKEGLDAALHQAHASSDQIAEVHALGRATSPEAPESSPALRDAA